MAGRPTKLTPQMHKSIVRKVKRGVAPTVAAVMSGITDSTYVNWMERGRNEEEPFFAFMVDIEAALASVQAKAEATLYEAFSGIKEKQEKNKERTEACPECGTVKVTTTVETTKTTKRYWAAAMAWLERRDRNEWAPPKAADAPTQPPDRVTAGSTEYTDEWLESDGPGGEGDT